MDRTLGMAYEYTHPLDKKMVQLAFQYIQEGNLFKLKGHPMWDLNSGDTN
jgi:hypothetical protein